MVEAVLGTLKLTRQFNMRSKFITSLSLMVMTPFMVSACANEGYGTKEESVSVSVAKSATSSHSVMDEPVNFSTPAAVKKSLQQIQQQAGEDEALELDEALQYLLYYDMSVGHNEQALHKKLDGKTPNQIIALAKAHS